DAGELDPGLDGEVRKRVGQQDPQPLSMNEMLADRRGISPVEGCAGSHHADQGRRQTLPDTGPAHHGACLTGKGLGPVPLVTCPPPRAPRRLPHSAPAMTWGTAVFSAMRTASAR